MPSKILRGKELREYMRVNHRWAFEKVLAQKPWPKQLEISQKVFSGKHKYTEISGCVGSTKTYALAMTALLWLVAHKPSRVFSLAPSFRQVDANLWGYMKQIWNDAKANGTPLGRDKDLFTIPKIQFHDKATGKPTPGWYYEGFSTDEPHNVHGLHGPNDLVIIDDAHGIKQALTDEIENIMAGGNTRIVLAYNKMVLSGPTYAATHKEAALWNHVGVAYSDLVNARRAGYKLDGALGKDAVERWGKKYGKESNFYRVKVLNLHPKQEKDTLIPLDWIEAAFVRAERRQVRDTGELVLGGDIARQGDDANCMAFGRGRLIGPWDEWHEPDTMVTAGRFVDVMKREEAHEDGKAQLSKAYSFIDVIGIGAGVVDRLCEQDDKVKGHRAGCRGCEERIKVSAVNGAEAAEGDVKHGGEVRPADEVFKNMRTQVFWNLREMLDPKGSDPIGMVRDDDVQAQLSCIRWRVGSDGRIEVEPKMAGTGDQGTERAWGIKNRLGFSPDKADSTAYCAWGLKRIVKISFEVAASEGGKQLSSTPREAIGRYATSTPLTSGDHIDGFVPGGLDGVE